MHTDAIMADMEAIMVESVPEGHAPKNSAEIFFQVLPKTTFIKNAGLEIGGSNRITKAAVVSARVQELEWGDLDAERQVAIDHRGKVEHFMKQVDDSEASRMKQSEELENLKEASEEIDALVRGLLKFNKITGYKEERGGSSN